MPPPFAPAERPGSPSRHPGRQQPPHGVGEEYPVRPLHVLGIKHPLGSAERPVRKHAPPVHPPQEPAGGRGGGQPPGGLPEGVGGGPPRRRGCPRPGTPPPSLPRFPREGGGPSSVRRRPRHTCPQRVAAQREPLRAGNGARNTGPTPQDAAGGRGGTENHPGESKGRIRSGESPARVR